MASGTPTNAANVVKGLARSDESHLLRVVANIPLETEVTMATGSSYLQSSWVARMGNPNKD